MFDLNYTIDGTNRQVSALIGDKLVGPFVAAEAGPLIVAAMVENGMGGKKECEARYMMVHFSSISRGTNNAGVDYPYLVTQE